MYLINSLLNVEIFVSQNPISFKLVLLLKFLFVFSVIVVLDLISMLVLVEHHNQYFVVERVEFPRDSTRRQIYSKQVPKILFKMESMPPISPNLFIFLSNILDLHLFSRVTKNVSGQFSNKSFEASRAASSNNGVLQLGQSHRWCHTSQSVDSTCSSSRRTCCFTL